MQKMDKTGRSRGLFSRGIPLLALLGVVVFMAAMPGSVHGQVDTMNIKPKPPASNWSEVVGGWEEFSGPYYLLDISLILLISIILAAVIAYHPSTRRKASNITEFEQPKTFLMYAMVGALIAQLVQTYPPMALVIFGIGGLLRFRTVVGEAKDTGRVILVTVVGLCCGLKILGGAVLATLIGWILIWYLESQNAGRVVVKGLKDSDILAAAETYRGILGEAGCTVIRERKNLTKGRVTFIVKSPPELDAEALEEAFEKVPEEQRGVVDWEIS
ncbi:MAG: hypothetical protein VX675_05080 [Planctomycetota bacterium]|nr:hypothetical protein [Planctomycetota bacterium]